MPDIIDVSSDCGAQAGFLAGTGVKTVIRYYSRDTGRPAKRLSRAEALAFAAAGLRIGVVHEARHGDSVNSFSEPLGKLDAAHALSFGRDTIGQPEGSAIYFGVDFDASAAEVRDKIVPYFQGVAATFGQDGPSPYRIGVYGSGRVCGALLDAGLAELAWLAQSRGWADFAPFRDSGRWAMRQLAADRIGEVDCDPDIANGTGIGDFQLDGRLPQPGPTTLLRVNARPGLRLRAGPGTGFDVLGLVPDGTVLHGLGTAGDWTRVDLEGDGTADGFASSHFLQPA